MPSRSRLARRRGSVLPLVAISMVGLVGMLALGVDVGMLLVARTQCQNAADAAAMAGARALDGSSSANFSAATTHAINAAVSNSVLSEPVLSSEVTVEHGAYHYDVGSQTFMPQFPPAPPDNYNLTRVTISHQYATTFARIFDIASMTVTATATAAQRPRDVCIVLDFSGSMNNESDLWNNEGYLGSVNNTSNNTDPVFPQFGPYSPSFSPLARLQCTSADPRVGKCNVTHAVLGMPPIVDDFFQNARGASSTAAFSPAPGSVTSTNPAGDNYLPQSGTSTPAKNWSAITGSSATAFNGYTNPPFAGYTGSPVTEFAGYTQGPGYWGKTFFIWPPDPRAGKDWRKKFFFKTDGVTPQDDNTKLYNSSGVWRDPPGNYVINYAAILNWIKNAGPNPFPSRLRAGNILYYDQIPDDVPASAYNHSNANRQIADQNQRFWKEYIDFVIGVYRGPMGSIHGPQSPTCSYGPDFTCGTSTDGQDVQIRGPYTSGPYSSSSPYIDPLDSPKRPRHRFWFGPATMVQYLLDTGLLPGTAHDISMYSAKLGVAAALEDIRNNHPNDLVSLILFSRPHFAGEPDEVAQFVQAQFNLSRDYDGMIEALWFPPNTSTQDVRPWDADGMRTPRPHGDYNGNTATSFGLMLAYNQLSSNATLSAQLVGGLGRRGAQRLIVLETDGMANVTTAAGLTDLGANDSYYNILPGDSITSGGGSAGQAAIDVATRLCSLETDSVVGPGFAKDRKPVIVHCVGFGPVFEPTASGSEQSNVVNLLQQISTIGGTVFPSSSADADNGYKWCIGTLEERQARLRQAFTRVMDDGVSVVLVE